jgi:hypothetical protein
MGRASEDLAMLTQSDCEDFLRIFDRLPAAAAEAVRQQQAMVGVHSHHGQTFGWTVEGFKDGRGV